MRRRGGRAAAVTFVAVTLVVAIVVVLLVVLSRTEPAQVAATELDSPAASVVAAAPTITSTTTTVAPSTTLAPTTTAAPTTTTTIPWRQTVGESVEGRRIELYTLGAQDASWRVLIIGGIHGSEHGAAVAGELVAYLEEHPEAVPEGTFLQIIPNANPDGKAAGTRTNSNGVDINRNFPSKNWSSVLNPGDRPSSSLSGGESPGSEPETQVIVTALTRGWDLVISLHSPGGFIINGGPGGPEIAERMSEISGMPMDELDYQTSITGSLGTYVPERYGIPIITVELKRPSLPEGLREAILGILVAQVVQPGL